MIKKQIFQIDLFTYFSLENWNIPHFETSAKEGTNVERVFETVARNALAREKEIDSIGDFPDRLQLPTGGDQPPPSNKCPS